MADCNVNTTLKKHIRLIEDEFDVNDLQKSTYANVHGIMTKLSPMRASTSGKAKYYGGELSVGHKNVWIMGFDTKMHNGLSRFQWPSLTVRLRREVLIWTEGGDTEIIRNSPFHSKFDVTEDIIAIEELSLIANFQYVSVRVKVITGEELAVVKKRVIKQDFYITDAVGSYKVVTWKENVCEISLKTKRQVRDWWYVVEDSTTKLTMDVMQCDYHGWKVP